MIATTAVVLPAAASVGSPSSTVAGASTNARASALSQSTNVQKALAYAHCMRAHGVLKFPDPNSCGVIPKVGLQQLGVSSTVFQAAQRVCQHPLPTSGPPSHAWDQKTMNALRKFARRARPGFELVRPRRRVGRGAVGDAWIPAQCLPPEINTNSPLVKNAMHDCQHLLAGVGYGSGGYP
ncbi:MAG TPA: hypothetical protein VGH56_11805 [Solirubrobacteraceae bacterium]